MKACIILHNMIVEDERDSDTIEEFQDEEFTFTVKRPTKAGNAIGRRKEVRDSHTHQQLKRIRLNIYGINSDIFKIIICNILISLK